ncbi:putative dynein light intermediate chain [Leptomonas pyrrhocoris]|uniref:Cytoplasmic dynein 2 light intermediate chain 1 n=1 Tax=Leptomonas pyrrhocoris TaxID=157538 RepID=A0A0M9G8H9_LEPPY|nr:putative dynein light intermediate chain [Leptomonas pyrrhocoris]KPA84960.1 putative dynein light intermediate chain [Leptomonas pyrrhocoris]|eukprot:XP_015663399.1 putative dynein light intermediate chain [Leptomonas pyrrhocoris]
MPAGSPTGKTSSPGGAGGASPTQQLGSPVNPTPAWSEGDDAAPAMSEAAAAAAAINANIVIDPTKDLWQNITRNVKDANVEQTETNLAIVGASGSGKTTLLHRIYSSFQSTSAGGGSKKVKPTTALDYSFARRSERNVAQVAHFWEIAQGTQFSQLLDIVVTPENVHAMVAAVVVDASEDGLPVAWETATYWLRRIDHRVSEVAERMKARGSTTPEKIIVRAQKTVGTDHPDLKRMRLSGLPTVLVVNKIDAFRGDTQQLKLLCRSMRYLAHLYSAHVIFTNEAESVKWRALMNHILFQAPFDNKYLQTDPERGCVLLTVDRDSFVDIGDPNISRLGNGGGSGSTGDAELDRWKAPFDEAFPTRKLNEEDRVLEDPFIRRLYDTAEGGFGEPAIDALRKQKDEELEQYRKNSSTNGAAKNAGK